MRFTVRRPANAEVSPCCHRPSGGDVACSVHVGVARPRAADFAFKDRLALAVFERDVPAHGASLRRVRGRDLLDPTKGFVLQTRGEQTPSAAAHDPVESALLSDTYTRLLNRSTRTAGHRPHVKGFDADRVEAPRYMGGGLFSPVLASVSLTCIEPRDRHLGPSSPVGAALGTRESLLQHLQTLRLTRSETGGVQQFTGRQCRRHGNAAVDAHHAVITRTGDRLRDVGERDMPAAGPVAGNPVGLHTLRDRPRQAKAHPADLRYPHTADPTVQTLDVVRLDSDLPKPLVHPGFAPGRATVRSGEKVAHGLGEVPQGLLLHGLGASRQPVVLGSGRGQLSAVLVVAGRAAPGLPVLLLFDGQVPYIPGVVTMRLQRQCLLSGRKKPVSRHASNVAATTDKSPKGEAVLALPAKTGDFHAAAIR